MTSEERSGAVVLAARRARPSCWVLVALALAALALAPACGGGGQSTRRVPTRSKTASKLPARPVKLPPVKRAALREFEAGMRAIRLAGASPSADAIAKAKERFQKAAELDGKLWEAWFNLGAVRFLDGDDEGAIEAFTKTLEVNPAHSESILCRAEANRRGGHTKEALEDYRTAITRAGDDSPVKRNAAARMASLFREAKQYNEAVDVIRDTLRTAGANAKVYVELALVYLAQGRSELAELVLAKAAAIDAKDPAVHNAFALLALQRGRSQEAFDRFDHATSLDPNYLDARFNKAGVLIDAGDFGRAKAELAAVVEKSPDDLNAWVALGVACRGLGEYDQARSHWERVIQRASRRSQTRGDALFNLAILQMNFLENSKAAGAALDRYLQEAPRNHEKRQLALEKKKELGL